MKLIVMMDDAVLKVETNDVEKDLEIGVDGSAGMHQKWQSHGRELR